MRLSLDLQGAADVLCQVQGPRKLACLSHQLRSKRSADDGRVTVKLLVHNSAQPMEVDEPSDDESEVFDAAQLQDIVDAMTRTGGDDEDGPTSTMWVPHLYTLLMPGQYKPAWL